MNKLTMKLSPIRLKISARILLCVYLFLDLKPFPKYFASMFSFPQITGTLLQKIKGLYILFFGIYRTVDHPI